MPANLNHPIATAFKGLRKMSGLTQHELADIAGFSREKISAIENGHPATISNFTTDFMGFWIEACQKEIVRKGRQTESKWLVSQVIGYITLKLYEKVA